MEPKQIAALVDCILSGQVAQEHVPRLAADVSGLAEALRGAAINTGCDAWLREQAAKEKPKDD